MVVCRFFLQGNCKFGNYCKFEHQINDQFNGYQNQSGTSILRQPNFASVPTPNVPNPEASSNVDTNTLVKAVTTDMTMLEKGGQWMLSCYAPFKEKPAFPGFEDQSFEELRLAYYEATKSGTVQQYICQIQDMIQQVMTKVKTLQHPSPDIVEMLKKIYNTPPSSQSGVFSGNIFSSPNTSSLNQQPTNFGIFAQGNQKLLNAEPQQQNTFGSLGSNIFARSNQNIGFGGQVSTNSSPFTTNNSPIAPNPSNNSIFAQNNVSFAQQQGSLFGDKQVPQPTANSIFGAANNSTPITSSFFGNNNSITISQAPPTTQNIFGNQNSQSVFGQAVPQNMSIFGAPATQNVMQNNSGLFGVPQVNQMSQESTSSNVFATPFSQIPATNTSVFGQQSSVGFSTPLNTNSPFAQTQSIAETQMQSTKFFGGTQTSAQDETFYSKVEDLTADEIKWFESDDLNIINIPEKPPTRQMCFKV